MPRPRTPVGAHGNAVAVPVRRERIETVDAKGEPRIRWRALVCEPGQKPDAFRARAYFRFDDGRLRQVERFAPSKAKAEHALRQAMTELSASAGTDVKRETRISDLADQFLLSKANRAPRTVDTYRQTIEHLIKPGIGSLGVGEANAERLQRFVDKVAATNGPGAAKACRSVLSGMMGLATRSGAMKHNPVRELAPIAQTRSGAVAIPLEQLPALVERVRADERLRQVDLVDLIVFLAGTGARVSEACALRWEDVDLEASTVTIRANIVRARGRGVIRQDHTKTKAGARTIAVPGALTDMLTARRVMGGSNAHGLVFPTVLGNVRDPRGTSRDWAQARERLGFPEVTTHSFRKTVATALDRAGLSARDIAEYLGHENPSMTQDVYMAKSSDSARAAAAMGGALGG